MNWKLSQLLEQRPVGNIRETSGLCACMVTWWAFYILKWEWTAPLRQKRAEALNMTKKQHIWLAETRKLYSVVFLSIYPKTMLLLKIHFFFFFLKGHMVFVESTFLYSFVTEQDNGYNAAIRHTADFFFSLKYLQALLLLYNHVCTLHCITQYNALQIIMWSVWWTLLGNLHPHCVLKYLCNWVQMSKWSQTALLRFIGEIIRTVCTIFKLMSQQIK